MSEESIIFEVSDIFPICLKETAMATITTSHRTEKLKTSTTIKPVSPTIVEQHPQNGDEIWEELWATSESDAFILQMEAALEDDIVNGRVEKGGFGDAD